MPKVQVRVTRICKDCGKDIWGHKKIYRGKNLDAESKMKMLKAADEKRKMQKEYDEMMKIEIHSEEMKSTSFYLAFFQPMK